MKNIILAAIAFLSLSSCLEVGRFDAYGNQLPEACYDLSDVQDTIVQETSQDAMRKMRGKVTSDNETLTGLWVLFSAKDAKGKEHKFTAIFVNKDIPDWDKKNTLEHEYCHEKMYRVYGDSRFHE